MAKKVVITFNNPPTETNIDHLEVWWKLTVGGTYAQLGSDIPFVTGVTDYEVEDTSVNVADDAVLYYQARAYNDNGGELETIDYSKVEANITISSAAGLYILDTYPNAVGAYSLRQLKTGVTSVVEVRRDSDNAVADFTAEEVTDGTLATWVGVNDGFVSKLYDQSGNANDAVQATDIGQPKIVSAGSVILSNGKPTIDYVDELKVLRAPRLLTTNIWSINAIYEVTNTSQNQTVLGQHGGTLEDGRSVFLGINMLSLSQYGYLNDGTTSNFLQHSTDVTLGQYLASQYANSDNYYLKLNSGAYEEVLTNKPYTPLDTDFTIGGYGNNSSAGDLIGKFSEAIIWDTDKTTNRVAIEAEMNSHYNVY